MMKYTKEHEWIKIEQDNVGVVGITEYAKNQLGNLVFVELPSIGKQLSRGSEAAVVESVKAASEIYAPVSGEVIEINEAIISDPGLIDNMATAETWLFKMKVTDPAECDGLMNEDSYQSYVEGC